MCSCFACDKSVIMQTKVKYFDKCVIISPVLPFLLSVVGSIAPSGGYCIDNQCFAVFRDPSDFSRAQNECRDQEGQLMTVRSSVAHDVLSVLLGNFTGSFWIGLHRPLRCPDPVARLRGYEWVTKDDESDFSNWLPDFNMNCSSQRCVSVSPELDFRWSQKPCQDQAAGFLCEYTSVGMCQSQESPGETMDEGGYKCSCYDGYRVDPKSANKCKLFCGKEECPAECDPNNKFQCYCPDGYVAEERGDSTVCIDMDECSDLYCEQKCKNTFGSYACFCSLGYMLVDGYKCVESDDDSSEGTSAPDTPTTVSVPHPHPTRQPSGVPPGGLVGIIIFTAVFIVLVVFLADRAIRRRAKRTNSIALKAEEDHGFHQVKGES
uniref:Thrombomodulin n=1 Tax=Neolamprologus brichardi TaxID=32507 RepID=A0A3Q4GBX6_NEOBR